MDTTSHDSEVNDQSLNVDAPTADDSNDSKKAVVEPHDEIVDSDTDDNGFTSSSEAKEQLLHEKQKKDSIESLNSRKELSTSEYDLRASTMRAQVEEKIKEIESKLWSQDDSGNTKMMSKPSYSSSEEDIQLVDEKRVRSSSMYEIKQLGVARLQRDLDKAHKELASMDLEVHKLSQLRDEVGAEIEDLTASLFEEANKMVNEANVKRELAQKSAKEANMKFSVLQEEVQALKNMVESFAYCSSRGSSKKALAQNSEKNNDQDSEADDQQCVSVPPRENYEVDPVFHQEFVSWRQNPTFDKSHPLFRRIYAEDVNSTMCFKNKKLADKVLSAIEKEKIVIEMLTSNKSLPKKCALLEAPRFCKYKMNIGDNTDYFISILSRNRIAAVCELFCYLKYIEKGLIKQSIHEVYLEILKKRRNITAARLGLMEDT